jgi:hypothetical protein
MKLSGSNMRIHRFLCLAAICLLAHLIASPLSGQQPSASLLDPDSAELHLAFFQFHSDFSRWSEQRKASDASAAGTLDDDASRHLKIERGDLGKLTGVTNSVMAELKKVDRDAKDYLDSRARYEQRGEPAVLQTFLDRREQAAMSGVDRLRRLLSPASWTGLHDYINNIHRLRYHPAKPGAR